MAEIALVTYLASPGLTPDDQLLAEALRGRGVTVHVRPWDAPADWHRYDLVVLRSPWDYFLRMTEFSAWVDRLEAEGVRLVNPFPMVRWNGDKRYLLELQQLGVAVVPTHLVPPPAAGEDGGEVSLAGVLAERGWTDGVVKPVVSGGGHATWRTSSETVCADEARFQETRRISPGGVLVQPFMPQIVEAGEWSLLFVEGKFSHAAIKRARPGSFLVQHVHGGTYAPAMPAPALVDDAMRVLEAAAECSGVQLDELVYARVDGIATPRHGEDRLVLMELECLEPALFFLQAPAAAGRMADALLSRMLANSGRESYLR